MLGRAKRRNRECMDDRGLAIRGESTVACRSCGREHAVVIDADGGTNDVTVIPIKIECSACDGWGEVETGRVTNETPDGEVRETVACAACDGTGFAKEKRA